MRWGKITHFSYVISSQEISIQKFGNDLKYIIKITRETYMSFSERPLNAVNIFISYADEDEDSMLELEKHLGSLVRSNTITISHRNRISPGTNREEKISEYLASAHIMLLLLSADFMASNYCFSIELKKALERHEAREIRIVPIILRPVEWGKAPFSALQPLPTNGKAITLWHNRDEAFAVIVRGIQETIADHYLYISSNKSTLEDNVQQTPDLVGQTETQSYNLTRKNFIEQEKLTDIERLIFCKATIKIVYKQLRETNLRNIHYQNFSLLKQKLSQVRQNIEHIKNPKIKALLTESPEALGFHIQASITEIETFLSIFDKILSEIDQDAREYINIKKIEEGIIEFYRSLGNCRNYIATALQYF
jgi:hypothetical protein